MFVRSIKVPSSSGKVHEYVRIVASVRNKNGQARQKVVANLGRRETLEAMLPLINRFLDGSKTVDAFPLSGSESFQPLDASTWGPMLVARTLFDQLNLWEIFEQATPKVTTKDQSKRRAARQGPQDWVDRAMVLVANRLTRPGSEHALGAWLESDYVCDRTGRRFTACWKQRHRVKVDDAQLQLWYRTLDRLVQRKEDIEVALYHRLRDLFSLSPDLVFYDLTSTYFEGHGPGGFAKHGYSRDGKPRNVQVVVGVVMVAGWPIAHHIWAGNARDTTTVPEVLDDLAKRFEFGQIVFVGDRGMVSQKNFEQLKEIEGAGFLLGMVRRRNPEAEAMIDRATGAWIDCPAGINAREKGDKAPKTRVQEVACDRAGVRVFVVDSDERRAYEQRMRERSMKRARESLDKVVKQVEAGRIKKAEKIGAAVQRALQKNHGHRYWDWTFENGTLKIFEHPIHLKREKKYEGKYLIQTDQPNISPRDAVQQYKQLNDVERGFRCLKDVLAMRPIYHRCEDRVRAHIFVAALAFLLDRLLERHLKEANSKLSSTDALKALETIRHVTFKVNNETRTGVTPGNARAREVLRILKIDTTRPPTPPKGLETKM